MNEDMPTPFEAPTVPQLPPMFHNAAQLPELLAAFAMAQAEYLPVVRNKLVVQKLKNKQTGDYTGGTIKFMYAELETILDATRPFLSKNGLTFSQPLTTEPDGTWVNSILAHKAGAMIITRMLLPKANSMSEFGGNITFYRRYAAGPALGVSGEDDSDNKEERDDDDGRGGFEETEQRQPAPSRAVPARRSAAAAQDKPAQARQSGPSLDGHINAGQVKFLQGKLKALKLSDADAQALFERLDIDGFTESMGLAAFAKAQTEMDRMRDA